MGVSYLAPTPRERERWYAILLLAQRDPHTTQEELKGVIDDN